MKRALYSIKRALYSTKMPYILTNEQHHTFSKETFILYNEPYIRPTQSIMYIPFQVIRFQKIILLIVQYKYLKSCSEDLILKNPNKI